MTVKSLSDNPFITPILTFPHRGGRDLSDRLLCVAGALFAITWLLSGCVSSAYPTDSGPAAIRTATVDDLTAVGPTPIAMVDTPTEFSAVSEADVAEARSRLVSVGVTPPELAEACRHYAESGWAYAEAWDGAMSAGRPRIGEVVAEVNTVAEEIALPGEWVRSITGSVDKSPALWTEAERDAFDRAIVVRKSKLIEPLCAP